VQQALEASQAALRATDQQKDQFLAMLAHELRNPLMPISTEAHLLKLGGQDDGEVRQAAEIIERQAWHMRALIEDLIDVSRVTRGIITLRPRRSSLDEVVAAAIEQVAPLVEQKRHALQVSDHAPGLALVLDRTRITQVVANLLHNAAKYTPQGGAIDVELAQDGDEAIVRVQDSGQGMTPALIACVFDLFTQADSAADSREGGLGVGLSLARSLAQLHGGRLTAHSAGVGLGSTFELRLPLVASVGEPAA